MSDPVTLAWRTFKLAEQTKCAHLSGDLNPMHLDPVFARRTQAGAPVVHGVHLLLWALDAFAAAHACLPPVRGIRVLFDKFVYLDNWTEVTLINVSAEGAQLNVCVNGTSMCRIRILFGECRPGMMQAPRFGPGLMPSEMKPADLTFEQMSGRSGRIVFSTRPEVLAGMFVAAANWLGAQRVAALAASSQLVGMICPGLHSIFNELSVEASSDSDPQDSLAFRVTETDPRFRLVCQSIAGGGLIGTVKSFARIPPVQQLGMQSLAGLISPTEFAGSVALVVGGSRGLGELTAKLIAAGGGHVIITWHVGRDDAEKIACEIRAAGGGCETLHYDARGPADEQLASLLKLPTHLYYFATPLIHRPRSNSFLRARLDDFLAIYVDGFWNLSQALSARQRRLSIFYPSSVAVTDRPPGMTEYAMAKAAGEALCADMNVAMAPLHITISRLPRLLTDQTTSVLPAESGSPLETMLPIVRAVQCWTKALPKHSSSANGPNC